MTHISKCTIRPIAATIDRTKPDENKRFIKMVKINTLLNNGGG